MPEFFAERGEGSVTNHDRDGLLDIGLKLKHNEPTNVPIR